ncbi:Kdo hydroxylase family protein [Variovorax terrae]|uniref:Kdo hydroxylase family protein n=1 Tax=Variovorax terrae TaxID=2923278 RepID=A0A9X1VS23_9BURK|nr:Kdo hydroxylase family protein [Variovorax terrae]MCJ0762283.1 Kdo hydroxylase family protein [Variovorax terrae]
MTQIVDIQGNDWGLGPADAAQRAAWLAVLERGGVLHFPGLRFALQAGEVALIDPRHADPNRKNISLDPRSGVLHGVVGDAAVQQRVQALITRFHGQARELVDALAPSYGPALRLAPTSLRLFGVEGRETSWRKDDSRLHVDAFPSRPNYGERILRVFTNLNPAGRPRVWRVGEPFEAVAARFASLAPPYRPWAMRWLERLHVTKSLRSEYDHLMLYLHDLMKADLDYQRDCPQQTVAFPAGSTWVCFSDQTSHAVMSGQFMMEQTLHLPVAAMREPGCSPLACLERLMGHPLVPA